MAWLHLAAALAGLNRPREALACYDHALLSAPDSMRIRTWRKVLVTKFPEAGVSEQNEPEPVDAKGWVVRAGDFSFDDRFAECVAACDRALALDPENESAVRFGIRARLKSCDWRRHEEDRETIAACVADGVNIITPFNHRTMCDSEAEHLEVARIAVRNYPPSDKALWRGERYGHKKIRVAYVSTDLRMHAVSQLIIGCLEHHDRSRFETTGISLSPDDGTEMRKRAEAAFGRFVPAENMSDLEIAKLMREQEIDIAIDLNGHTTGKRTRIFSFRPAPIQANFLGFPGTIGATFFDYVIADPIVIPEEHRVHYSEKVAYLPHAYQPNDSKRPLPTGRRPHRKWACPSMDLCSPV
jgi:predicted O-linked N-acetylglucosamine transferase (SPINDLY family)